MSSALDAIHQLTDQLPSITLGLIDGVSLLNRVDTKYVLHERQLRMALEDVGAHYHVLDFNGFRIGRYATTYFDTPEFGMFHSHHNGERVRYKVRCRSYVDSCLYFFEVKAKTNRDRTVKNRVQIPAPLDSTAEVDPAWLPAQFPYDVRTLVPVMWNRFRRLTLVSLDAGERVTIDIDIQFGFGHRTFTRDGLVVAEVKQRKRSNASPFGREMHLRHIQPQSFSKFCMGTAYLYPTLKQNRFKPLFLHLDQICPVRGYDAPRQ
jgi:hypothetical protein